MIKNVSKRELHERPSGSFLYILCCLAEQGDGETSMYVVKGLSNEAMAEMINFNHYLTRNLDRRNVLTASTYLSEGKFMMMFSGNIIFPLKCFAMIDSR